MRFERADKSVRGSIFINSNTIYWVPMDEKKICKYDCTSQYVKEVYDFSHLNTKGKSVSTILRYKNSLILISLINCYEIIEYDLERNNAKILYQESKEVNIFNSFLCYDKVFLFPESTNDFIVEYSLTDGKTNKYAWDDLNNYSVLNKKIYFMDYFEGYIYGVFYGTNIFFEIDCCGNIKCKLHNVDEKYLLSTIKVSNGEIYSNLINKPAVLKIDSNKNEREIYLVSEKKERNELPYCNIVKYNKKLFILPAYNDFIQVYDEENNDCFILNYPLGFHRVSESRLFWNYLTINNFVYLLPLSGNDLLILDMDKCCLENIKWAKSSFEEFLQDIIQ